SIGSDDVAELGVLTTEQQALVSRATLGEEGLARGAAELASRARLEPSHGPVGRGQLEDRAVDALEDPERNPGLVEVADDGVDAGATARVGHIAAVGVRLDV